jgi:MYXO-CTERM domain-containing protein
MRPLFLGFAAAGSLLALPASAAVIMVSPADGTNAYTKIEGAQAGDEVVIAPGTYSFRVYLQNEGTPSQPIYIHAQDPANPPIFDPKGTDVANLPGSYGGGDRGRGCWQVSGGSSYIIEGIVFQNCRIANADSAGLRYYNGTTGLQIRACLFQDNDNGLTGGTEDSDATVEFCEFSKNGNNAASSSAPTHNAYIYGGTFALRYSYLHDPVQGQNLHCRAVDSTIEYNWFDRAKSYVGDLMTSDDYANNPTGSLVQKMTLRGNVIVQGAGQANNSQLWAIYNDEASGSPVSFSVTALYNTVVGAGGHAAFIHVSNADSTQMTATLSNNVISGTSVAVLVEDASHATVSGKSNWIQSGAAAPGLSGSVSGASPGFNGAASDDFTLAAGSACIGAADTSVPGLPTKEYYKDEMVTDEYRVRSAANDIGAFEHDTAGPGVGPYTSGAGGGGAGSTTSSSGTTSSGGGAGGAGGAGGSSNSGGSTSSGGGAGNGSTGSGAGPSASSSASGSSSGGTTGSKSGCHCTAAGGDGAGPRDLAWIAGLAALAARRRRRS